MKKVRERIKISNNRAYSFGTNFIAAMSWRASPRYRKKLPMSKRSGTVPYRGWGGLRERIKISNNRAYSSGTNFIADMSWRASPCYRKQLPMSKSLRNPSIKGLKGVRERIKNYNNRAYSLGTNFIADISWRTSPGYRKKLPMSKSLRNRSL